MKIYRANSLNGVLDFLDNSFCSEDMIFFGVTQQELVNVCNYVEYTTVNKFPIRNQMFVQEKLEKFMKKKRTISNQDEIVLFNITTDYWIGGLSYALNKGIKFKYFLSREHMLEYIKDVQEQFVTIIASPVELDHSFFKKAYESTSFLVNGKRYQTKKIGYLTGRNVDSLGYLIYKNLFKKNEPISQSHLLIMGDKKFTNSVQVSNDVELYTIRDEITKETIVKPYDFISILGAGREDRVLIGKNNLLFGQRHQLNTTSKIKPEYTFEEVNRNLIAVKELSTKVLMVNGCMLGRLAPSYVEFDIDYMFSLAAIESGLNSLIVSYSAKDIVEAEGLLMYKLFHSNLPIGSIVVYMNQYCSNIGLQPTYVLFGDPTIIYSNTFNNISECYINREEKSIRIPEHSKIAKINLESLKSEDSITFVNNESDIFYFEFLDYKNREWLIIFSNKENLPTQIDYVRKIDKESMINALYTTYENYKKHNFLNINPGNAAKDLFTQLEDKIKSLNRYNVYSNYNNQYDKKIENIINESVVLCEKINDICLNYWIEQTQTDKRRLYDLHYNLTKPTLEIMLNDCPVCGNDYYFHKKMNHTVMKSIYRYIDFCPTCSIINDVEDSNVTIVFEELTIEEFIFSLKVSITNNSGILQLIDSIFVLRGKKKQDQSNARKKIRINPYSKVKLTYVLSVDEINCNEKYYPILFLVANSGYYFYKRPISPILG